METQTDKRRSNWLARNEVDVRLSLSDGMREECDHRRGRIESYRVFRTRRKKHQWSRIKEHYNDRLIDLSRKKTRKKRLLILYMSAQSKYQIKWVFETKSSVNAFTLAQRLVDARRRLSARVRETCARAVSILAARSARRCRARISAWRARSTSISCARSADSAMTVTR